MWGPGSSDPYCTMQHAYPLNGTYKTETINENLNPTWTKGTFGPIAWIPDRAVVVEVYDSDSMGADDSIGKVSLTGLTGHDSQEWYPLSHEGKKGGKVRVKLAFTDIDYSQWKAPPKAKTPPPAPVPAAALVPPPAPAAAPVPVAAGTNDDSTEWRRELQEALTKNRDLEDENERLQVREGGRGTA